MQVNCSPAKAFDVAASRPQHVIKTNDLARKTGAGVSAEGTSIIIKGRVVGENCLPVSGALVEMWQADSAGKTGSEIDENFSGSGTIYTNNLGEFYFLTVFPGAANEDEAPYVNLRVAHRDVEELHTRMYFPEQPRNLVDTTLRDMSEEERDAVTSAKQTINGKDTYSFNITAKGKSKTLSY